MGASCCFIEPSCEKVEICNPYAPVRTLRPLSGTMTATSLSPMFSGWFVALLFWGCTTVDGLVAEHLAVQPATTIGYHSVVTANTTYGVATVPFACGNDTHRCPDICNFCSDMYGAPTMDCLSTLIGHLCLNTFESSMASLNSTDWCIWGNVSGLYSNLSHCTEEMSDCLLIPWPNPLVEETFVDIHTRFFQDCPAEELTDPPPVVVLALVVTPICLIPVMVILVVFKTKNGDGSY
ncbi:receptor activity-modifying protein 2 isoform X2 [Hippoglossus hippoglossus]|uniref:receptor activity-modifying protein 2 isoform X2 n=1 Tax=Hippoglossus hippoglossus TaxID=8267 RepID=UPI00148BA664|nr:receptor activity-modifying protein 2 isoform X2 [Hippoglossus hippoglossus]XP_035037404.1 receptor activity-modifying protein 2 isoform X2 [Hippoglossus stenolepis]